MSLETAVLWQSWLGFVLVSALSLASIVIWGGLLVCSSTNWWSRVSNQLPVISFLVALRWKRQAGKCNEDWILRQFYDRFRKLEDAEPELAATFLRRVTRGWNCDWDDQMEEIAKAEGKG